MILADIRRYLAEQRRVSLRDIALHFGIDEAALRGMLATFERKGQVRRIGGARCGSCCGCPTTSLDAYEWTGASIGPAEGAADAPCGSGSGPRRQHAPA